MMIIIIIIVIIIIILIVTIIIIIIVIVIIIIIIIVFIINSTTGQVSQLFAVGEKLRPCAKKRGHAVKTRRWHATTTRVARKQQEQTSPKPRTHKAEEQLGCGTVSLTNLLATVWGLCLLPFETH